MVRGNKYAKCVVLHMGRPRQRYSDWKCLANSLSEFASFSLFLSTSMEARRLLMANEWLTNDEYRRVNNDECFIHQKKTKTLLVSLGITRKLFGQHMKRRFALSIYDGIIVTTLNTTDSFCDKQERNQLLTTIVLGLTTFSFLANCFTCSDGVRCYFR